MTFLNKDNTAVQNLILLNQTQSFNRSNRYKVFTTQEIVSFFESKGFVTHSITKARVRKSSKEGFQKHIIRFRHPDFKLKNVNDLIPEIVVVNSYDGSTPVIVMLGVYRLVCSNGMIVGDTMARFSIRHVGQDLLDKIWIAAAKVQNALEILSNDVKLFQDKQLTEEQSLAFVKTVLEKTQVLPDNVISVDFKSAIKPRRDADQGNDLWTTLNRLQESVIRGGVEYTTMSQDNVVLHRRTRRVSSVTRNVELNLAVWEEAKKLALAAA